MLEFLTRKIKETKKVTRIRKSKDRQFNGEGQTIQWQRTDNSMVKDRQFNGKGKQI